MFVARLICSDMACAAETEAEAATVAELETLVCECGCALEVIGWPDAVAVAEVVQIRLTAGRERRAA